MADCQKHFHCTHNYQGLTNVIALGILFGAATLVQIIGGLVGGALIPGVGFVTAWALLGAVFALCDFLHGGKLICIQEETCVIGRIVEFIPVGQDKSGFEKMDDDFTFNVVLSPHSSEELIAEVTASDPYQGPFLLEQPPSANEGLGYAGVSVKFTNIDHDTEVLHCEVKGCRVHDVCIAMKAAAVGGAAVAIICSIPVVGWVACLIAVAIWAALTAAAISIAWAAAHNGDINDVYDPASGQLEAADPDTGLGGSVVVIKGDWVYDAGHSGWNEIHPVRHVQKLKVPDRFLGATKADAALVEAFKTEFLDPWCFHVKQPDDEDVKDSQDEPKNDWHIHPDVDGCEEPVEVD
jgi:hypothetical protein